MRAQDRNGNGLARDWKARNPDDAQSLTRGAELGYSSGDTPKGELGLAHRDGEHIQIGARPVHVTLSRARERCTCTVVHGGCHLAPGTRQDGVGACWVEGDTA